MTDFTPDRWVSLPRPAGLHPRTIVQRRADPAALAMSAEQAGIAAADGPQVLRHDGDEAIVRFWHHAPDADAVAIAASGWWRLADPAACDLRRASGGWWSGCFVVPADWQASYRLLEHSGDGPPPWWEQGLRDHGSTAVVDPLAAERHRAGRGGETAVVRMPGAERPWLSRMGDAALQRLDVDGPRTWWWAAESATPLPLIVLTDGAAHVELGTHLVVQAAIEHGLLPPVALVLVDAGEDRAEQLGVPWGQAEWIATTLIPRLRDEGLGGRSVTSDRRSTLIGGSSFGGLTALFAVARAPETIGCAIAQSTSFWRYAPGALVPPLAAAARQHPLRLRLQSGSFEGHPPAEAEAIAAALRSSDVTVETRPGGHDWAWWMPALIDAAIDLLGRQNN